MHRKARWSTASSREVYSRIMPHVRKKHMLHKFLVYSHHSLWKVLPSFQCSQFAILRFRHWGVAFSYCRAIYTIFFVYVGLHGRQNQATSAWLLDHSFRLISYQLFVGGFKGCHKSLQPESRNQDRHGTVWFKKRDWSGILALNPAMLNSTRRSRSKQQEIWVVKVWSDLKKIRMDLGWFVDGFNEFVRLSPSKLWNIFWKPRLQKWYFCRIALGMLAFGASLGSIQTSVLSAPKPFDLALDLCQVNLQKRRGNCCPGGVWWRGFALKDLIGVKLKDLKNISMDLGKYRPSFRDVKL